jgi:hypothetical protein
VSGTAAAFEPGPAWATTEEEATASAVMMVVNFMIALPES